MRNLSKWIMLFCSFLLIAPYIMMLSLGGVGAEPIETGQLHGDQTDISPVVTFPEILLSEKQDEIRSSMTMYAVAPEPLISIQEAKVESMLEWEDADEQVERPEGEFAIFEATAYTIAKGQVPNLKGITATGTKVKKGRTIAVDPKVIPLGSLVYVESDFPGVTGYYIAEDTGSAIKGNKIDVFFGWGGKGTPDYEEAINFGRRDVKVIVVREGPEKEDSLWEERFGKVNPE